MVLISGNWWLDLLLLWITFWIVLYKYFTRHFDYWKVRGIPYIKPEPFFGNFREVCTFKTIMGIHVANLYNKMTGPYFGMFILDKPYFVIKDPELVKMVLVKDFNYFQNRTVFSNADNEPIAAHMLFVSKNPEWKIMRNKVSPVYTTGKLRGMLLLINEVGEELKSYLSKNCLDGKCVEVKEICSKFTTDVISSCAFGINAHSLDAEGQFRKIGRMIFDFRWKIIVPQLSYFFAPELVRLFKMKFIDPEATALLQNAFMKAINERERRQFKRNDLIDILVQLKNEGGFCDDFKFDGIKIVAQAVQFFLAGFETTSSTIAFTLYELSLNQKIQEKVRAEMNVCLQKYGGFTYESFQEMKYLEQCILETLRKYPVLAFLDRMCMADYKVPGTNVTLEKGTRVYIPTFGFNYDPKYFPDPHKYDPDRFAEMECQKRHPYVFLPFGEGPRICIGERFGLLATKAGLTYILSDFEVHKGKETPSVIDFETKSFFLASKCGIPLVFKRITSQAA